LNVFFLSDLHLAHEGELVRGQDTNAAFDRGWVEFAGVIASADLVVACGDISHNGCMEGYMRFQRAVEGCATKVLATVGNHDDREMFSYHLGAQHFCETGHAQSAHHGSKSVILLDTLVPGRPHGALCQERIAWLSDQLRLAAGRPVIAVMHHPPLSLGIPALDDVSLLEGRSELLSVLESYPGPLAIFSGHHHIAVSNRVGRLPIYICPAFSGPPAKFGLWRHPPEFGPGANGACGVTIGDGGSLAVHFLTHV
jgi:3',5'-cyclic-AMP phosphodiesterase